MAKKEIKIQFPKIEADNLFSTQAERDSIGSIRNISISKIIDFKDHPFKVIHDDKLDKMVDSIRDMGVVTPLIVRPTSNDKFELISGHRRKFASELALLDNVPVIVKDLDDDEAIILMVDSNIQREEILPSEKAFAYKMKLEALNHQGKRIDLTSAPVVQKLEKNYSRDIIAKENGESGEQVRRYIRLTELIPELLNKVDNKEIAFRPAVELSFLSTENQVRLDDYIQFNETTPSLSQAIYFKKMEQEGRLNIEVIEEVLDTRKPNQIEKLSFNREKFRNVLPRNLKETEIENYTLSALKFYAEYQVNRQKKSRENSR